MSLKAGRVGVNPEDVDELGHIKGGGGGGTEVVPNPEGEATEILTKLGIDGTVFGFGDGVTVDELWVNARPDTTFQPQSITIGDLRGYDFIRVLFTNEGTRNRSHPLFYKDLPVKEYFSEGIYYYGISGASMFLYSNHTLMLYHRDVGLTSGLNGIQFVNGQRFNLTDYGELENQQYVVPMIVYGVKYNV